MANKAGFKLDISDMVSRMSQLESKADMAVHMMADTIAKELEADMKENARWTDRTGNARRGLKGEVGRIAEGYRIILSYSVDYGFWLENAHERRYAIIRPTINIAGPFYQKSFRDFLDKLG